MTARARRLLAIEDPDPVVETEAAEDAEAQIATRYYGANGQLDPHQYRNIRPKLRDRIYRGTIDVFGGTVGDYIADLINGIRSKAVDAPAARSIIASLLPPPPEEAATPLPGLVRVVDARSMMEAIWYIEEQRKLGTIRTREARELHGFIRDIYSSLNTYQCAVEDRV